MTIHYNNSNVRRQDRLLEQEKAIRLLENGEYGILSMQAPEGGGYGIPINYVWDGKNSIYLHCAPEGKKLRCIESSPEVSFCIVGRTQVIPGKFTTAYESIILSCRVERLFSQEERWQALDCFLNKYSPENKTTGMKYAEKSFDRTGIIRLEILSMSGKCKRVVF